MDLKRKTFFFKKTSFFKKLVLVLIKFYYIVKVSKLVLTMTNYIPLVTYEYKLAFCQATNRLPEDTQRLIWNKVLDVSAPTTPPLAPMKSSKNMKRLMNGWSKRKIDF